MEEEIKTNIISFKVKSEEVAQPYFGISWRRYRQMAKEGIVPEPDKGIIDFVPAAKGLIDYYRKLAEGSGSLSLTDERTELVKIQRQLKTLELEIKQGELIPRALVLDEFLSRIHAVRSGLMSLPRSLPQMFVGLEAREIGEILKKEIHGLLEKFSRKGGILKK